MSSKMKRLSILIAAAFSISILPMLQANTPALADSTDKTTVPTVIGDVLYSQPSGERAGASYPSVIRLEHQPNPEDNGLLMATFFGDKSFEGIFGNPVYISEDDGYTWNGPISFVKETQNANKVLWEPRLFELPQAAGSLPKGTIIYAGRSFGQNGTWYFGCEIQLYYSTDVGQTWQYLSTVATSAPFAFGSYEPHVAIAADGGLVVYWSDELTVNSDPDHDNPKDQAIVHRVSYDGGQTWGPIVQDVVIPGKRPGMPTVVKLPDGRYVMSYEVVGDLASRVRIKFSNDGLNWDTYDPGTPVQTPSGAYAGACPYMTYIPGTGQLVVSSTFYMNAPGDTERKLFVNDIFGSGEWSVITAPVQWQGTPAGGQGLGYVQPLLPTADGSGILHMSTSYVAPNQNDILYARSNPDTVAPVTTATVSALP